MSCLFQLSSGGMEHWEDFGKENAGAWDQRKERHDAYLTECHAANEWKRHDLNPGLSDSKHCILKPPCLPRELLLSWPETVYFSVEAPGSFRE